VKKWIHRGGIAAYSAQARAFNVGTKQFLGEGKKDSQSSWENQEKNLELTRRGMSRGAGQRGVVASTLGSKGKGWQRPQPWGGALASLVRGKMALRPLS